ncbi:hypothetical protein AB0I37_24790 [Micromonospora purpureochromogenes]|uniref:hypothetical protein n=1 Tax=Micromonospora purpureochromogenes TaxID=47872 RepID=UPI0033D4686E
MHHTTIRRVLLLGAFTAAGITGAAAYDAATHEAHADIKPGIVAEQGGLLGHDLPRQASDRAKAAVAKVTAEPTPEPTEDTPAEPEPTPTEDQAETPAPPREDPPQAEDPPTGDRPTEPTLPVEAPPAELPPVEVPLPTPTPTEPAPVPVELPPAPPAETPPPPVEVPPTPTPPPAETPPAPPVDPLPEPPADLPQPAPPAVPAALPIAVGPMPAVTPAGNVVEQLVAELTAGEAVQPLCADDPDDARHIDRDALRALLAGLDHKPAPTVSDRSPCRPQTPAVNTTGAGQVKPPPPTAADLIVAIFTGSHVPPPLGRMEHARPRAHLPASRHVAIEPGPA